MIITSNQVPSGKWNVAGWYVTCISNCVLGNGSLNAIDSWGIQHYADHQPSCLHTLPSPPMSDKKLNNSMLPFYHYLAQSQKAGKRSCQITKNSIKIQVFFFFGQRWTLILKPGSFGSRNVNPHECNWMQLFSNVICINPYKMHFPGRCQSVPTPPDAWASLTKGRSKLRHFG